MLLSMTGYGDATFDSDSLSVSIELRALNNRYLKVSLRAAEPYNLLEPEFEKIVRKTVRRGTVQVHMRLHRRASEKDFQINSVALRSYLNQLRPLGEELGLRDRGEVLLAQALALPGVAPEPGNVALNVDNEWPVVERVLEQALAKLQAMRQEEGRAMAQELLALRDQIGAQLAQIRERMPTVASNFRERLFERVRSLLAEHDVEIDRSDLIKEVAVFAERSDVAEEATRLASHLEQFQDIIREPESAGRKLEFLTQEMFREANTIGSKAGEVEISRHVVEIKSVLERVRELIQNVE